MKKLMVTLLMLVAGAISLQAGKRVLPTGTHEAVLAGVAKEVKELHVIVRNTESEIIIYKGYAYTNMYPGYLPVWIDEKIKDALKFHGRNLESLVGKTNDIQVTTWGFSHWIYVNGRKFPSYVSIGNQHQSFVGESDGAKGLVPPPIKVRLTEGVWIPVPGLLKNVIRVETQTIYWNPGEIVQTNIFITRNGGCSVDGNGQPVDLSLVNDNVYLSAADVNLESWIESFGGEADGRIILHLRGGGKEIYNTWTGELMSTDRLTLTHLAPGLVKLNGPPGRNVRLEGTEDFSIWSDLGQTSLNEVGEGQISYVIVKTVGTRGFFRGVLVD